MSIIPDLICRTFNIKPEKKYQDNHGIWPPMHFKPSPNARNRPTDICHGNNKNKKKPDEKPVFFD
ncbi:MAG: hypothetical protein ACWGNI_11145 [Desulfobacterales bacterium]